MQDNEKDASVRKGEALRPLHPPNPKIDPNFVCEVILEPSKTVSWLSLMRKIPIPESLQQLGGESLENH